jgi:hypothetical protein
MAAATLHRHISTFRGYRILFYFRYGFDLVFIVSVFYRLPILDVFLPNLKKKIIVNCSYVDYSCRFLRRINEYKSKLFGFYFISDMVLT